MPHRAQDRRIRICVATSYAATAEPRAARYTAELAKLAPSHFEVVFIDCVPIGQKCTIPMEFRNLPNVKYRTSFFAWRGGGRVRLLFDKLRQWIARRSYRSGVLPGAASLSTRAIGLQKMLLAERAEIYFGFNIDTLIPVYRAARAAGAPFLFDCQEIYSEMTRDQPQLDRDLIRTVEQICLPECSLVLAASPEAAEFIEERYGLADVLPLLNVPPMEEIGDSDRMDGFTLYWRNGTVDLGPRGLSDALHAMQMLPPEITLCVQGRPAADGGERVRQLIRQLGIGDRVVILPPFRPEEAVRVAARHQIGLALESPSSINADLTTANKFFDYAMAGLAIVSTRTKSLHGLVTSAGLGLVYEPGDAADLARQIMRLYEDRELLASARKNARRYALGEGNLEFQMQRFREAFRERVLRTITGPANIKEEPGLSLDHRERGPQ